MLGGKKKNMEHKDWKEIKLKKKNPDKLLWLTREFCKVAKYKNKVQKLIAVFKNATSNQKI